MSKSNQDTLRVEALQAKHLPMLALTSQTKRIGWMQMMLIKTWLAEAEEKLQGIIPTRQPRCYVALEKETLIALIVLQPHNRRGSCWAISLPEFIKEPESCLKNHVFKTLIKTAFNADKTFAKSWIIKSSTLEKQNLSLLRELGFQPMKILKSWQYTNTSRDSYSKPLSDTDQIHWESLSKNNVQLLLRLKNSSESVQLREMLDSQSGDLLDRNQPENGILINKAQNENIAILGLITSTCSEDFSSLELIRDTAWDSRIEYFIDHLLAEKLNLEPTISIETSSEDKTLNKFLKDHSWTESDEYILLGRSIWKRQVKNNFLKTENSLDSIFGVLKPNQPPLPSPSICIP